MLRGSPTTSNIDPIAVRIIMIALLFTGVGLVAYLIAWIAIPSAEEGQPEPPAEPEVRHRTAATLGATLVAVGLVFLLRGRRPMMHAIPLWPILVVGAGAALAVSSFGIRRRQRSGQSQRVNIPSLHGMLT
jgi:phage shock protein C